ncbi:MAG TPA: VOC family protein [Gemmatimonadales bacterium]|nr:VOC family protein [Gemmatimonadales bacterium]
MKIVPYLNFDGKCAEAFRFYQQVLGGKLEVLTHSNTPIAGEVPPGWGDRVLHACLRVGDQTIMASDTPPEQHARPQGLYVSLHVDRPEEAERIFGQLAEQGEVTMPLGPTFWALRFGVCVDRFGTPWMINCGVPAEQLEASMAGR